MIRLDGEPKFDQWIVTDREVALFEEEIGKILPKQTATQLRKHNKDFH